MEDYVSGSHLKHLNQTFYTFVIYNRQYVFCMNPELLISVLFSGFRGGAKLRKSGRINFEINT